MNSVTAVLPLKRKHLADSDDPPTAKKALFQVAVPSVGGTDDTDASSLASTHVGFSASTHAGSPAGSPAGSHAGSHASPSVEVQKKKKARNPVVTPICNQASKSHQFFGDDEEEEEEEEEEESDDGASDEDYVPSGPVRSKMKKSLARKHANGNADLSRLVVQKKERAIKLTEDEIDVKKKEAVEMMESRENNLGDNLYVALAGMKPKNATFWSRNLSPGFAFFRTQEIDIFSTFSVFPDRVMVKVPETCMSDNLWSIPKLATIPNYLVPTVDQHFELLKSSHQNHREAVSTRQRYKRVYNDNSDLGYETCPVADGITIDQLRASINHVRQVVWKTWHAFEDSETEDVRDQVIAWIVENLKTIVGCREFHNQLKRKLHVMICLKMRKQGQTTIPEYLKPIYDEMVESLGEENTATDDTTKDTDDTTTTKDTTTTTKDTDDTTTTKDTDDTTTTKDTTTTTKDTDDTTTTKDTDDTTTTKDTNDTTTTKDTDDTTTTKDTDDTTTTKDTNDTTTTKDTHDTTDTTDTTKDTTDTTDTTKDTSKDDKSKDTSTDVNLVSEDNPNSNATDTMTDPVVEARPLPVNPAALTKGTTTTTTIITTTTTTGGTDASLPMAVAQPANDEPNIQPEMEPKLSKPIGKPICEAKPFNMEEKMKELEEKLSNDVLDEKLSMQIYSHFTSDDVGLSKLLFRWEIHCRTIGKKGWIKHAIIGILDQIPANVYRRNVDRDAKCTPPSRIADSRETLVEFAPPSEDFTHMALELLSIMNIFMTSLDDRNKAPVRWNWKYHLLKMCDLLSSTDIKKALLVHMVCLILSCATEDWDCVGGTVALHKAGYMDVHKLANASWEELAPIIYRCGIYKQRAKYLVAMAKDVIEHHDGIMPSDFESLMNLAGAGRKTSLLMTTEIFGFFNGIPSDKHVHAGTQAYGLVWWDPNGKHFSPEQAEASLREWVPHHKLPSVNKIMGSFAQLFTNTLKSPTAATVDLQESVMEAMTDYLHKKIHIEMMWCAIAALRRHYLK